MMLQKPLSMTPRNVVQISQFDSMPLKVLLLIGRLVLKVIILFDFVDLYKTNFFQIKLANMHNCSKRLC